MHVFRGNKEEIVKAVTSHGTVFNMFYQSSRKGLASKLQQNVINLVYLVIMYSSMYFYYIDALPDFYSTLSLQNILEIIFGVPLMILLIYVMNKWYMNPAYIILRECSSSKEEGRQVVVEMLKYMRAINLTLFLCVILLVYLSYRS